MLLVTQGWMKPSGGQSRGLGAGMELDLSAGSASGLLRELGRVSVLLPALQFLFLDIRDREPAFLGKVHCSGVVPCRFEAVSWPAGGLPGPSP